jgi:hypothetical protein
MKCCICGVEINGYGNNPDGACWKDAQGNIIEAEFDADARCCDECNERYVIPGRIYRLNKQRRGEK